MLPDKLHFYICKIVTFFATVNLLLLCLAEKSKIPESEKNIEPGIDVKEVRCKLLGVIWYP